MSWSMCDACENLFSLCASTFFSSSSALNYSRRVDVGEANLVYEDKVRAVDPTVVLVVGLSAVGDGLRLGLKDGLLARHRLGSATLLEGRNCTWRQAWAVA